MNNRFEKKSNTKFGHNDAQRFAPPVRVDEELEVRIEAVGEKGDGVAKKNGFVLFIPGVKENEYVRVKVTKVLKKVGFAEVIGPATPPTNEKVEKPHYQQKPQQEAEEEFTPSEDDSEDFGEDAEDAEDADEDLERN